MTSYLHTIDHMEACRSRPLQRVTSLRRRVQANASVDRVRRVEEVESIVQGVTAAWGGACNAPLPRY